MQKTAQKSKKRPFHRQLKVTTSGRVLLFVTVGVGVAALNTGNNLLYLVLGLLLSLIVLSGVLSEWCLRDMKVRRLLPKGVRADGIFSIRYELERTKGRAFAVSVREGAMEPIESAYLLHLAPKATLTVRASYRAQTRGPFALSEIRVSTLYPFGFFMKTRLDFVDETLIVYPKKINTHKEARALPKHQLEGKKHQQRLGDGDILGLRELRESEHARRIHARKSAQLGKTIVVDRQREEAQQYLLKLHVKEKSDALDKECEEVAAIAEKLLKNGYDVGVETAFEKLPPAHGPSQETRILGVLAWAGFEELREKP